MLSRIAILIHWVDKQDGVGRCIAKCRYYHWCSSQKGFCTLSLGLQIAITLYTFSMKMLVVEGGMGWSRRLIWISGSRFGFSAAWFASLTFWKSPSKWTRSSSDILSVLFHTITRFLDATTADLTEILEWLTFADKKVKAAQNWLMQKNFTVRIKNSRSRLKTPHGSWSFGYMTGKNGRVYQKNHPESLPKTRI